MVSGATRLFDQQDDTTSTTSTDTTTSIHIDNATTVLTSDGEQLEPCMPVPPAIAEIMPTIPPAPDTGTPPSADSGTFRLCGADPAIARAIEQLVAGRAFSTSLVSRGDGCAELKVQVTSPTVSGSATSNLNVSIGSGRSLHLRIVSQGGATHVELSDR
jgi:hypothetical protein